MDLKSKMQNNLIYLVIHTDPYNDYNDVVSACSSEELAVKWIISTISEKQKMRANRDLWGENSQFWGEYCYSIQPIEVDQEFVVYENKKLSKSWEIRLSRRAYSASIKQSEVQEHTRVINDGETFKLMYPKPPQEIWCVASFISEEDCRERAKVLLQKLLLSESVQ